MFNMEHKYKLLNLSSAQQSKWKHFSKSVKTAAQLHAVRR